ncbi:MAG TPA: tyrosine-type recombinase/integrase [Burkholderiales bacterium]|nr:tyrosine-type recombinase/integrase [Burkholderiales bacterium]
MGSRTGPRLVRRGRIWYTWVPKPGGGTRRVGTNCTDRKAAAEVARDLERRAADPAYQASYTTTVQQACDRYLASRKRAGRAAGTLHHYTVKTSHLTRVINVPLAHITIGIVERYIDTRTNEGAARTTVKKELRALGAVLRHAKRLGLWTGDVGAVIPEYADDYQPRKRSLAWNEVVFLLAALEKPSNSQPASVSANRSAMIAFIVATGARWGEAVRAQREDVTELYVALRGTKTKLARRTVPVVPMTEKLVGYAMTRVGDRKGRLFDRWTNPNRDLEVACKQASIPKCTPNDLRRTIATWMRASGVDTSVVAAFLGHTTSRMVERVYGRLSPEELRGRIAGRLLDQQGGTEGQISTLPAPRKEDDHA